MRTDQEAKQQIIQITNELFEMGLLTPTGGNISARGADPELYWITPSQMYKGGLTADDLVCIRPDGTVWRERGRPALKGVANPPRAWRLVATAPPKKAVAARSR